MEYLTAPITLMAGESLIGRDFWLTPDFAAGTQNAVIVVAGDDVTIKDVRLFGPRDWPTSGWARPNLMGIRAESRARLLIERVQIEGLPAHGIYGYGWSDMLIRDVVLRHVFVGINSNHYAPSYNVLIERVHVSDTWGTDPAYPSRVRPGGCVGGDGMALNSLRASKIKECIVTGEVYVGFKLTNPQEVAITGCRGTSLMVQGVASGEAGNGMTPARDVLIEGCIFDQGLGYDNESAGAMHITLHVASCHVHRNILNGAGRNGHAIKLTHDAHATIDCNVIRDFNGTEGAYDAHALDLVTSQGASANEDFVHVNRFVEQDLLVLVR